MAARVAFLLNLDAERELADPKHYRRTPEMDARIAALSARMEVIAPHDWVIGRADRELAACEHVVAFCPTPRALARIRDAGLRVPRAPSLEVLRTVNARSFCAALGQTLPAARHVRDMEALLELLANARGDWLLKRDFGFAGRERMKLRAGALDASSTGFARRSFARGEGLQVEPWLPIELEVCQHGYLTSRGALLWAAPRAQVCDAQGSWSRSAELPAGALDAYEREALQDSAQRVACALRKAGYFGPFGIDAYRYRTAHGASFQPRSELNARLSMGYPRGLLVQGLEAED